MDSLTIGIIIGVVLLIVVVAIVVAVSRYSGQAKALVQTAIDLQEKLPYRAPSGQRDKQIQTIPSQVTAAAVLKHDSIFQKIPPPPPSQTTTVAKPYKNVQAILFLDFDQTITVNHLWHNTDGKNDPSLLTDEMITKIFGSQERIAQFKKFWAELNSINGLEIQVLSKSWENMIRAAFQRINLAPLPSKITGTDTLQRLEINKSQFVLQEQRQRDISIIFFADDTPQERQEMQKLLPGAFVCCSDLHNGLTEKHMQYILKQIRSIMFHGGEKWIVTLHKSGGIMGMIKTIRVASYGKVQFFDKKRSVFLRGELNQDQLVKLNDLLNNYKYTPSSNAALQCADCFTYTLEIERDGQKKSYKIDEKMPELAKFLSERLREFPE